MNQELPPEVSELSFSRKKWFTGFDKNGAHWKAVAENKEEKCPTCHQKIESQVRYGFGATQDEAISDLLNK